MSIETAEKLNIIYLNKIPTTTRPSSPQTSAALSGLFGCLSQAFALSPAPVVSGGRYKKSLSYYASPPQLQHQPQSRHSQPHPRRRGASSTATQPSPSGFLNQAFASSPAPAAAKEAQSAKTAAEAAIPIRRGCIAPSSPGAERPQIPREVGA